MVSVPQINSQQGIYCLIDTVRLQIRVCLVDTSPYCSCQCKSDGNVKTYQQTQDHNMSLSLNNNLKIRFHDRDKHILVTFKWAHFSGPNRVASVLGICPLCR